MINKEEINLLEGTEDGTHYSFENETINLLDSSSDTIIKSISDTNINEGLLVQITPETPIDKNKPWREIIKREL